MVGSEGGRGGRWERRKGGRVGSSQNKKGGSGRGKERIWGGDGEGVGWQERREDKHAERGGEQP